MLKALVSVTKSDIERGSRPSTRDCPVARALRAAGFTDPAVGMRAFTYGDLGERVMGYLPEEATRFIAAYDFREPVEPLSFYVEYGE